MSKKLKVLDLFSGIGGFSLGLERAGMDTVAFCEIDPFCQKVLKKHWPDVPIHEDVRTITEDYNGETIELICGGYPCQPFSVAGKRKGKDDDRHLWPAMFNCIKKFRPTWVIGENVAGHINMGLDQVLFDLEGEGYETTTFVIPACAVNAPHRRDRVWIIGYSEHNGQLAPEKSRSARAPISNHKERQNKASEFARANVLPSNNWCERIQRKLEEQIQGQQAFSWCKNLRGPKDYFNRPDIPKPLICRDDDGFSSRVDRLRSLGNAVVPQIPEIIGRAILEAENDHE